MISLDDDPILGRFFDTSEKKAKWLVRIKIAYIIWLIFILVGIITIFLYYFLLQ